MLNHIGAVCQQVCTVQVLLLPYALIESANALFKYIHLSSEHPRTSSYTPSGCSQALLEVCSYTNNK